MKRKFVRNVAVYEHILTLHFFLLTLIGELEVVVGFHAHRQNLVSDDSKRVNVAPGVHGIATQHLRRGPAVVFEGLRSLTGAEGGGGGGTTSPARHQQLGQMLIGIVGDFEAKLRVQQTLGALEAAVEPQRRVMKILQTLLNLRS